LGVRLTLAGLSVEQAHVFLSAVEGSRVPKRNKLPHELPYIFVGADEHGIDRDPRALPTLQDQST
jgi:hypothetical protein